MQSQYGADLGRVSKTKVRRRECVEGKTHLLGFEVVLPRSSRASIRGLASRGWPSEPNVCAQVS